MNKFNKININKIIFDMYKTDISNLLTNNDLNMTVEQKQELLYLSNTNNVKTIFEGLNNFFEKNIGHDPIEFSVIISLLLQRYNYLSQTQREWDKYFNNQKITDQTNPGIWFLKNISPFFSAQINLYIQNYFQIIKEFNIDNWNKSFNQKLNDLLDSIINEQDFNSKLELTEQLVLFFQDTKNIYSSLESVGIEQEKNEFLTHSNELKIVFQSMNNLIQIIIGYII